MPAALSITIKHERDRAHIRKHMLSKKRPQKSFVYARRGREAKPTTPFASRVNMRTRINFHMGACVQQPAPHTHTYARIDNEHNNTQATYEYMTAAGVIHQLHSILLLCLRRRMERHSTHTHIVYGARADMQGVIRVLILMRADVDMRGACQIIYSAHEAHTPVSLIFSQHFICTHAEREMYLLFPFNINLCFFKQRCSFQKQM
jgi:hypothetical protein